MPIEHLPADTTSEAVAAVLARDGCVVVDRLAPGEVMDAVDTEMKPYVDATKTGVDPFSGHDTRRTGALIARSPTARDLVTHPLVLATAKDVLEGATNFQLHLTQIIAIGPGESGQAIHRDQWAFDFFPFPQGYEVQCNTLWAMTDFTEQNGATRVAPGSHKLADKLELTVADTEPAEMERGSVLVYTGALYHGGAENRSDATRIGLNITYNRAWLRQEENQYLSVPREIARELPTDLLRLMGYARGAYALGYIDDLRDPIEAVRPEAAEDGLGALERAQAQARREP
jgi:ectoine hydroxylase-related dioxygenase (phytanoyl-CoA dioxygenase family)